MRQPNNNLLKQDNKKKIDKQRIKFQPINLNLKGGIKQIKRVNLNKLIKRIK